VNEAYDVLKDADKKAAYDRFGHAAFEGGMGGGRARGGGFGGLRARAISPRPSRTCSTICSAISWAAAAARRRRTQRAARGSDLRYNLRVTLEEAYSGCRKTINVPTSVTCGACDGTGAEGGAEPTTCPTCSGMGKVRAQQGFFTVERTCPTCRAWARSSRTPATPAAAPAGEKDRALSVNIPAGVETGTRIRLAGRARRACAAALRAISTSSSRWPAPDLFQRDGMNLFAACRCR
jgi:molecular chaperone DnaJ